MRTLKKALSLVLVLAMVLSLGVSAFAVDKASEFSDYSTVTNKEAVDVLTAIGVINGNTDGTFGATGSFTRAQAATMISYLTLGKTVANALPTGATQFNDVPATHWAAKYVQYCANEGIINGYGDGNFGPDATLTSSQWALMLLGALGYNAKNESIGGNGWEIQVTKLAMQTKVASAEDLTGTFNRDMAAKMALNALNADTVTYKGGSSVTVNGVEFTTGATAEKGDKFYVVKSADKTYDNLNRVAASVVDDLGRPAHKWTMNANGKTTIGTYADTAAVKYTSAVQSGTVYTDLGLTKDEDITATVNGGAKSVVTLDVNKNDKTTMIGGNGVVTEIYKIETTDEHGVTTVTYEAVQVVPEFGKVTVTERRATTSKGAYTTYTVGGETGRVFSTVVNADEDKDTAVVTGDIENNDYVIFYKVGTGDSAKLYVEAVDTISGVLTAVSNKGVLTIDGTSYNKAAYGTAVTASKNSQTFYVDSYGNVIQATEAVDNTKSAMVISKEDAVVLDGNKLKHTYTVDVVETDGTVSTLTLADDDAYAEAEDLVGTAVTYTTNSKGVSTLGAELSEKVNAITNKSAALGTDTTLKASSNTKFFFVNWTKDDNGDDVVTGTVTTYTGTSSVPSYAKLDNAYAVDSNDDGVADVVFVYDNKSATVADNYIYVVGTYSATSDGLEVDVIIKGESKTLTVNNTDANKDKIVKGLYEDFPVANGVIGTTVEASGAKTWVKNNGGLYYTSENGEAWTYGNASIANDVPVYIISGDTCDEVTAETLSDGVNGDHIFAVIENEGDANAKVISVYIVND